MVALLQLLEVGRDGGLVFSNCGEVREEGGNVESAVLAGSFAGFRLLTADEAEEVGLAAGEVGVGEFDWGEKGKSAKSGEGDAENGRTEVPFIVLLQHALLEMWNLTSSENRVEGQSSGSSADLGERG